MITGNEKVHPVVDANGNEFESGITLRQHFAALAMQGLLANKKVMDNLTSSQLAHDAVLFADELIDALNYKRD